METGEGWSVTTHITPDSGYNQFIERFVSAWLAEAERRSLTINDPSGTGYSRHDSFSCYLVPRLRDELDEKIIEVLSGDHPARQARAPDRVAWGGCGQDSPLESITRILGIEIRVILVNGKVSTPYTAARQLLASPTPSPVGAIGYYRFVDELVARLRKTTTPAAIDPAQSTRVMELEQVPNDPIIDDAHLRAFAVRILTAYNTPTQTWLKLFVNRPVTFMVEISDRLLGVLASSVVLFGVVCWVVGFFVGRCFPATGDSRTQRTVNGSLIDDRSGSSS
jgi:hypothetical protein